MVGFFFTEISTRLLKLVLNQITAPLIWLEVADCRAAKGDTKHPRGMDEIQPCRQNPLVTRTNLRAKGELRYRASQTCRYLS